MMRRDIKRPGQASRVNPEDAAAVAAATQISVTCPHRLLFFIFCFSHCLFGRCLVGLKFDTANNEYKLSVRLEERYIYKCMVEEVDHEISKKENLK